MEHDDMKRVIRLKVENGVVKDEKKIVRQFHRQCKSEFLEENEYAAIEADRFSAECSEPIQYFDPAIHDAWLVQCPKGIDIDALAGKRIKMPGRRYVGDIQVRTTHYEHPLTNSVGYASNKGKYAVRLLPLAGHMVVSRRLNMERPGDDGEANKFPKPCGPPKFRLPVRHPFFGRDYKTRIEIDKKTAKKLRNADKKCTEVKEKLRTTSNFYKIRRKLLSSTQTLAQKEHDVRQSVLTGVAPKFMQDSAHPDYVELMDSDEESTQIEQPVKRKSTKHKVNGEIEMKVEDGDVLPRQKKKKKLEVNGSLPLNSPKKRRV
ncbi:uncharacterized protein [Drosophila virilis]|uniref:Uncharacterized protein n=1 Tax=Drosophila virilis TaxID=7244 RepID=B4MB02_DROVI|nr:uncharacterized protein LOC6634692 [Drosophila virilis]EDW66411.1 uncharacterized protein Dvir_GJ16016 [Drosophila virilis]